MRLWHLGLGFSLAFGIGLGIGCSATGNPSTTDGTGGAGGSASKGASGTRSGGPGGGGGIDAGDPDGFGSCAKFSAEAKQAPAAMLFVLDRSASMSQANKWGTAQVAVAQAIDDDAFDTMSLGMMTFPDKYVPTPPCLSAFLPTVACGFPGLPQQPLTPAGTSKSNAASGIRRDIYQYLVKTNPEVADPSDASPIYDALNSAYNALKLKKIDKRIAVLITDGGFSCTSLSSPTRPGYSDGLCNDWEYPDTVNKLINNARLDAASPINTFIVGVPGSDSHGEMQGSYATAPYSMKLALSTYAVSGSPDTVDPACNKSLVFTKSGLDPAKPCHIDLSSGGAFNPTALASAITTIRGKALGCVYDLPTPPQGQMIDPTLVNVTATENGATTTVPKRANMSDDCAVDGCWDYNAMNQVELIGKACADVNAATSAKVEVYVGCKTILK